MAWGREGEATTRRVKGASENDVPSTATPLAFVVQFIRYAGVGSIGTAAQYLTLILLVQFLRLDPIIASVPSFIVGGLINYFLNYRITFRSDIPHQRAIPKFFAIAFVGLAINSVMMAVVIEFFKLYYLMSQVIATGAVLVWTFSVNRLWTFKGAGHGTKY